MRPIKFRGRIINGIENAGQWVYWGVGGTDLMDVIDPETIGQFTGLLDSQGVEIYEGDIVVKNEYIWFCDGEPNYRGTVEWIYSQWQVIPHCVNSKKRGISDGINQGLNDDGVEDGDKSEWIVIGNIHQHPELLE